MPDERFLYEVESTEQTWNKEWGFWSSAAIQTNCYVLAENMAAVEAYFAGLSTPEHRTFVKSIKWFAPVRVL